MLRQIGWSGVGNVLGVAFLALPSVILVLLFAQTRIFFVMSRDGLLPEFLSRVHPRWQTPHVVTALTGIVVAVGAAFFRWVNWPISPMRGRSMPSPWLQWR